MRAVVAAFNQEKTLVGAFSVITNLRMELFQALLNTRAAVPDTSTNLSWADRSQKGFILQWADHAATKCAAQTLTSEISRQTLVSRSPQKHLELITIKWLVKNVSVPPKLFSNPPLCWDTFDITPHCPWWCSSCWCWCAWLNDSSPSKSHVTAPALEWNLHGLPSISASQYSGVPELRELKCWYNIVFCASCLWRLQNDININKKDQLKM